MESLTRFVLRRRRWVVAVWIALLAVSGIAASGLADLLTNRFVLPGTESERTAELLSEHFGRKPEGSFSLVAEGAPGSAPRLVPQLRRAATRAAAELPTGQVAAVQPVSDSVAAATIVSALQPADAKGHTADMREAAGTIAGATLYVTGQSAIEHDLQPIQDNDLKVAELFIAIPIALLILVWVFGTLAFLLPFAQALFAIPVTLGIVWIFAHFMTLSTYLTQMVSLIGLGIAIDYSLLIVYRYREERHAGHDREQAVVNAMNTAGRAVVFSGTAVAIGLALMLFMPVPFMRGFGLAGLLIPTVSVLAAVTVLPVLVYWLADRLDRVRLLPSGLVARREDSARGFWPTLAWRIMRQPLPFGAAAAAVLLLAAAPLVALELGPGSNKGIPQAIEAVQGLDVLAGAVGEGALAPTEIVVDTGRAGGAGDPEIRAAAIRLARGLEADPEIATVPELRGADAVDRTGRYLHLQAIGRHEYGLPESQEYVGRLRDEIVPAAAFPAGAEVLTGGGPAFGVDFLNLTYGAFPWLVLAVLFLTYLLLLRAFRSLVLPLKAIVLNLLSIGAAYGLLVAFFKLGFGEPLGMTQFDQIEGWIPVFLFAMLFGLSMDYEVFLVSRMREEWDAGATNEQAVARGLAKTGRLVTAAGLIMVAAFSGFVAGSIVGLQQFGFGLAAAILIDVTIVRALLVPSAMKLFGRWNWWLPERVARLFRVPASPLDAHRPALRPSGR